MSVLAGALRLDGSAARVEDVVIRESARTRAWDSAGTIIDGAAALHRQSFWTTPDAVNEHLPVRSLDQRFSLTYSGRIDNRDELVARYHLSSDASDGACLVAALSADAADGLRHCVGDFVIAAWDRVHRRLWLARDALGHRPLFYFRGRDRLHWSMDFRALRTGPAASARPNAGFIAEYLTGAIVSLDETIVEGIHRVPPACVLMCAPDESTPIMTSYWTPPQALPRRRSDQDLIAEFDGLFSTAVRACVRTNAPVAAELSGGLDSSSIVSLATVFTGKPPSTYSMVFPGASFAPDGERLDESAFIDAMCAATGATSHRHDPRRMSRADLLRVLDEHGSLPDWPNADAIRWPMVSAAAAAGHRVMLTGVGGDQWLTGSVARLPSLIGRGHWLEAWRFLHDATSGPEPLEALRLPMLRRITAAAAPAWIKRAFRAVKPATPWPAWLQPAFVRATHLPERLRALPARVPAGIDPVLRDSLTRLATGEAPLSREHMFRTADDADVEVRHPFANRRLVEFMLTLPDELRYRGGETRYILRQAMGTRLPVAIATRHDKGDASILITHGLSRVLDGMSLQSLRVADAGWIDGDRLRAACAVFLSLDEPARAPFPGDTDLWTALAVEVWLRAAET